MKASFNLLFLPFWFDFKSLRIQATSYTIKESEIEFEKSAT